MSLARARPPLIARNVRYTSHSAPKCYSTSCAKSSRPSVFVSRVRSGWFESSFLHRKCRIIIVISVERICIFRSSIPVIFTNVTCTLSSIDLQLGDIDDFGYIGDRAMFIPDSLRSCMVEPDVSTYLQAPSSGQVCGIFYYAFTTYT